jgi:hypothetical protein
MGKRRSEATREKEAAYRAAHRAEAAARTRAWAKANPEKRAASYRAWREKNKEKIRDQKRAWRKANPEKHKAANRRWKINARMPLADYERLLAAQGGVCAICASPTANRNNSTRLAVDHCHESGSVRGLLCHRCNTMLGQAKDKPEILRAGAAYLERGPWGGG